MNVREYVGIPPGWIGETERRDPSYTEGADYFEIGHQLIRIASIEYQ